MQLACSNLKQTVKLGKEHGNTLLPVAYLHTLDCKANNVYCREREVSTTHRCLGAETVLIYTGTATHCCNLVEITFWVVGSPLLALVESGVEIKEVREETVCRHLACKLIEVMVTVGRQVAHATLLLPYLDGEDGCLAIAHTTVGALEKLTDDATTLGRSIGTIVD